MRSLRAVWLIALLSLLTISATNQPLYLCPTQASHLSQAAEPYGITQNERVATAISFDDYWKLVSDTRQAIAQMEAKPAAAIRQELNALASQWEQVTAVEYPDHSTLQIDSSYLVTELRREPPALKHLENQLDTLLRAHEQYPQKVFTLQDILPLKEILARPEFQWQHGQSIQMPDWLTKLYDSITNFINRVALGIVNFVYQWRTVLKIAALILFVLSLFFISRGLSRSLAKEAQLDTEDNESDELLTSKGAFKRAETLSTQGDYRNAIRYLYLSSLLVLDEQGLMRYDRSRTNREYLRSVASKPEVANPLRAVIDVFDRVWYGFEGVDEETYQTYVERVDELREKKE